MAFVGLRRIDKGMKTTCVALLLALCLTVTLGCGTKQPQPTRPLPLPPVPEGPARPLATTEIDQIVELVNVERKKRNVPPLKVSVKLTDAAQKYAERMAREDRLSHDLGGGLGDRLDKENYNWTMCGENIAWNYRGAEDVMKGWMSSPGHRRNLLNPSYKEIGVGIAKNKKGEPYHCQDFGARAGRGQGEVREKKEEMSSVLYFRSSGRIRTRTPSLQKKTSSIELRRN
jgi:uncharacterized protein YkwD